MVKEVLIWVVFSFVFCVTLISIRYVSIELIDAMDSIFNDATVKAWMEEVNNVGLWLDYGIMFSYVSFVAGSVILAFFIDTHPVFYIPYMIGAFVVTFVSWILREAFLEFVDTFPAFQSIYSSFPVTNTFMANLPYYTLLSCVVIATVQYSKADRGNNWLKQFG